MENPIILNARLKMKRAAITESDNKLKELEAKKQTVLRAADDAETEEDLNKAADDSESVDKQIADIKADVEKLKSEVSDIEDSLNESNAPDPESAPDPETNSKKGGETRMKTVIESAKKDDEQTRAIFDFVKSNGQKRDGLVTSDLGALVPKDIIYVPERETETKYDLTQLIKNQAVTKASGTYQVLESTDEALHTVEELVDNPELGKPTVRAVDWKLATYRGQITYSEEDLQDVADFKNIIGEQLSQIVANTKNSAVAGVLKKATAKSVADVDGLKDIINVDLDPAYDKVIVASQSAYNFLDKLKDANGQYLLHADVTSPTGLVILGMPITIVKDTLLGVQGGSVAFVGDAQRFARFFDRIGVTVDFAIDAKYGRGLYAAVRFDVEIADPNAGFFVTFAASAPAGE